MATIMAVSLHHFLLYCPCSCSWPNQTERNLLLNSHLHPNNLVHFFNVAHNHSFLASGVVSVHMLSCDTRDFKFLCLMQIYVEHLHVMGCLCTHFSFLFWLVRIS